MTANVLPTYIKEIELKLTGENLEIHRCPHCSGVFGIDSTFTDQVGDLIACMMCFKPVRLSDPTPNKEE